MKFSVPKIIFKQHSGRVKCVDQHTTEPWLLCALYNGEVNVWNYELEPAQNVLTIKVCDLPVRAAKFVPRNNSIVTATDDGYIRIFNYNTLEKVLEFSAHFDHVRCIVVHPTRPFFLTCSDDHTIKLWNLETELSCQEYTGHDDYVMQIALNPKDDTFASASLDSTVMVWTFGAPEANFTLTGHEKGVNCVDYHRNGNYLFSGGEDCLVKIWDPKNRTCVRTLKHHTQNVTAVLFHRKLQILLSASEDGFVAAWSMLGYKMELSNDYGVGRIWSMATKHGSNEIAFGFDNGAIVVNFGSKKPVISMDCNTGKVVLVDNSEIQQINLKTLPEGTTTPDGECLPTVSKNVGTCDIVPHTVAHNHSGRFVALCGEGEYVIYTALAFRCAAFGIADQFVWASDGTDYATLENNGTVTIVRNFEEKSHLKIDLGAAEIFGGAMLGVKSMNEFYFYDWESNLVRTIEVLPRGVYWSESKSLVCLAADRMFYMLRYETTALESASLDTDVFTTVAEIKETVTTGVWIDDCFIYTDSLYRIKYYAGGEITTLALYDRPMYILGYVSKDNKMYLSDRQRNIVTYTLPRSALLYLTAELRGDVNLADKILPVIPADYRTHIAQILEKQGLKSRALNVALDSIHQFDLALSLGKLDIAKRAAEQSNKQEGASKRWFRLGTAAATIGDIALAESCYKNAEDYSSLLLLACSTGNKDLLHGTARLSLAKGVINVSFATFFSLGMYENCLRILIDEKRYPEAALFARSYLPRLTGDVARLWDDSFIVTKAGGKIHVLANPEIHQNLFPEMEAFDSTQKLVFTES